MSANRPDSYSQITHMNTRAVAEPLAAVPSTQPVAVGRPNIHPPDAAVADIRRQLGGIVRGCLGEVATTFEPPAPAVPAARTVGLYLLELNAASPQARQTRLLQFSARLLVTTWAPDVAVANDDLMELAFACLEASELEVDFEPLPVAAWSAFGVAPRPSFTLHAPVRRTRTPRAGGPLVRARVLRVNALRGSLAGTLIAHDDSPLAGAHIDLPDLDRATTSDHAGRFRFDAVPSGDAVQLRVRVRGILALFEVQVSEGGESLPPLRIDLSQPQP